MERELTDEDYQLDRGVVSAEDYVARLRTLTPEDQLLALETVLEYFDGAFWSEEQGGGLISAGMSEMGEFRVHVVNTINATRRYNQFLEEN